MTSTKQIRFETGLDELVDVNLRVVRRSKVSRQRRSRSILGAGLAFAVSLFTFATISSGVSFVNALVPLGLVAVALGAVFGLFYRWVYDSSIRTGIRKALEEQIGDRTWVCEIELRPETLWVRDYGVEMSFPWTEATAVEDVGDAIELRFHGGLVLARNKAFATAQERESFLAEAKALAAH